MHVRVRFSDNVESVVVVESKLTKIETFRRILKQKFNVEPNLQRLLYGGKVLEDGYTFYDYNIKLNDVIQVMVKAKNLADDKPIKDNKKDTEVQYKDAKSVLFDVGDLIDMKDREHGAWFEGKIVRMVHDPNSSLTSNKNCSMKSQIDCDELEVTIDNKNNVGDNPPNVSNGSAKQDTDSQESEKSVNKKPLNIKLPKANGRIDSDSILKYLIKSPQNGKKSKDELLQENYSLTMDTNLLYQVQLDGEEEPDSYCKLSEIRPRARSVIDVQNLKVGQKVMLNHNIDDPREKGYWYDFKINEINKLRTSYELIGTIYLGPEGVPQSETKVIVQDKVYAIEDLVPLSQRTEAYQMATPHEKRSLPLNCLTCRDDEEAKCKDCGCFLCLGKEHPEKIILCDECNNGFHMTCLSPPLMDVPEEDWYCPSCRRNPNDVIAPGAAKQMKKASAKSKRDWGRGMACVGKTKTSAMPANHFGPIPGIEVGMCWRFRIQLSESGVHRPPVSGIHGRDVEGAYSIVLSGGYEDDVDRGNEFTYTGSGGRDLSGNKRTAEQSCDQTLTRENKALARNCAVKQITEEGGDAGSDWQSGKPVRVVRSYKMLKHFPKYAPKEGIRYDGIYKVVKYYPEKGLSGYIVWKYLLRRDDPCPAPWEAGAKNFPIIYPDGYLEAEAEKKALKEKSGKGAKNTKANRKRAPRGTSEADIQNEASSPIEKQKNNEQSEIEEPSKNRKRVLKEISQAVIESETYPPIKKQKKNEQPEDEECLKKNESASGKEEKVKGNEDSFKNKRGRRAKKSPRKDKSFKIQIRLSNLFKSPPKTKQLEGSAVTDIELLAIKGDKLNEKLWDECLRKAQKKKQLVECVTQDFLCIICQDVAVSPVTTPCLHNFCMDCLKRAFKASGRACPCCRQSLSTYEPNLNEALQAALRTILPGYDAGKK